MAVILGLILLVICMSSLCQFAIKLICMGAENARELTVHAKVSWLFGLIKAVFALENGKTDLSVRIAWKKFGDSDPVEDKAEDRIEEKPKPEKKSVMRRNRSYRGRRSRMTRRIELQIKRLKIRLKRLKNLSRLQRLVRRALKRNSARRKIEKKIRIQLQRLNRLRKR